MILIQSHQKVRFVSTFQLILNKFSCDPETSTDTGDSGQVITDNGPTLTFDNCLGFNDTFCDDSNNNPDCGYDGYDCCRADKKTSMHLTCNDSTNCNVILFLAFCSGDGCDCKNPKYLQNSPTDTESGPTDTESGPTLTEDGPTFDHCPYFNEGNCDGDNNNPDCGYDGEDCCLEEKNTSAFD